MEPAQITLFEPLELDPELAVFTPENPDDQMCYVGLACPCGSTRFRLSGRLSVSSGRGGFFWRTLTRFLREARQPMQVEDCPDSPVTPPLSLGCEACGRGFRVLGDASRGKGQLASDRPEPEESLRCRACARGQFELVAGMVWDPSPTTQSTWAEPPTVEILSRCHGCHRQSRIAWTRSAVSDQERRLDLLYGRR